MFAPAYLDHNATTSLDARVFTAMQPWLLERCGNASSRHEYGRAARRAVDEARQQVADAVGAHPTEVVFTSGGSEANNLFLKGAAARLPKGLLAVSAIEHPCVREPARQLAKQGWQLQELAVNSEGVVDAARYAEVLGLVDAGANRLSALVSVMLANNETGVLQDIRSMAAQARAVGAWFHCDAVQALGKIPVNFRDLGVSALTVSSHKVYGPQGAAALVLDKRVECEPQIAGGGQERGLRSGTENVAAIVGFGLACQLAVADMTTESARQTMLRDHLEQALHNSGVAATVFSRGAPRLPNTTFFAVPGLDGETLVGMLDRAGFAVASGSACSSAQPEPSHTLLSMGVAADVARGAVRVSVGRATTLAEMDRFVQALIETVERLRKLAAVGGSTLAA